MQNTLVRKARVTQVRENKATILSDSREAETAQISVLPVPTSPAAPSSVKGAPYFGCRRGLTPATINRVLWESETPLTVAEIAERAGCTPDKVVRHLTDWHPETGCHGSRGIATRLRSEGDKYYLVK